MWVLDEERLSLEGKKSCTKLGIDVSTVFHKCSKVTNTLLVVSWSVGDLTKACFIPISWVKPLPTRELEDFL